MREALRTAVAWPLVERWLRTSEDSWRRLSPPSGPPAARAAGPDPDRILLFGSGIAIGYGAETHDLALAGQIARQVSDLTGRGVQVDVVAGEDLTVDIALATLTARRLRELDVVIATSGTLQKLLLMPVSQWTERIEHLLDHFAMTAPASLRVLFIAVPELSTIARIPWPLGWLADSSARRLNRALAASCAARPYAEFVPFRPTEPMGRERTGRTYRRWASLIAPSVASALDEHERASA